MTKRANRTTLMKFGDSAENAEPIEVSGRNQEFVRQFIWDLASINVHLEEIRYFWAKVLGISGPQWMILMALVDLDRGQGVAVKVVSKILHVDPSFVTTQSKSPGKKAFS